MLNTKDGLMAAILANPAEDGLRLAYADCLEMEEAGNECGRCGGAGRGPVYVDGQTEVRHKCPTCSGSGRVSNGCAVRAEFIRLQVELAGASYACTGRRGHERKPADRLCGKCRVCELRAVEGRLWNPIGGIGELFDVYNLRSRLSWEETADESNICLVSRGFISEVRAPLAVLVGGEACRKCYVEPVTWRRAGCTSCNYTGTTTGIAARLVREQPVEKWVATDKHPLAFAAVRFFWAARPRHAAWEELSFHLPEEVHAALKHNAYDTLADAMDDLSRAIGVAARKTTPNNRSRDEPS